MGLLLLASCMQWVVLEQEGWVCVLRVVSNRACWSKNGGGETCELYLMGVIGARMEGLRLVSSI